MHAIFKKTNTNFIAPYYSKWHQFKVGLFSQTPWFNIN